MFRLIKQVFIVLISFNESLARHQTKCLFLNDEPSMVRVVIYGALQRTSYTKLTLYPTTVGYILLYNAPHILH